MQKKYANRPVFRRHDPESMGSRQEESRQQSQVRQQSEQRERKARLLGRIIGGGGGLALVRLLREKGLLDKLDLRDILAIVTGSQAGSTMAGKIEEGTRRQYRQT